MPSNKPTKKTSRGPKVQQKKKAPRAAPKVPRSKPKISQAGDITSVKFSEFLSPVIGFKSLQIQSRHINPGDRDMFTWLPNVAVGYEFYRIDKLNIRYIPFVSELVDGDIATYCDYDPKDEQADSIREMLNNSSSKAMRVSKPSVQPLSLRDLRLPTVWKKVRNTELWSTSDIDMYDAASFYWACSTNEDEKFVGRFFVDYVFSFRTPQTNHVDDIATMEYEIESTVASSNIRLPTTTNVTKPCHVIDLTGQLPLLVSYDSITGGTSDYFYIKKAGDYLLDVTISCAPTSTFNTADGAYPLPYARFFNESNVQDDTIGTINWREVDESSPALVTSEQCHCTLEIHTNKDYAKVKLSMARDPLEDPITFTLWETVGELFYVTLKLMSLAHTAYTSWLTIKPFLTHLGNDYPRETSGSPLKLTTVREKLENRVHRSLSRRKLASATSHTPIKGDDQSKLHKYKNLKKNPDDPNEPDNWVLIDYSGYIQ